jgi:hypothetical protein
VDQIQELVASAILLRASQVRATKIVGVNFLSGHCCQCLGTLRLYPVCLIYTLHTNHLYHAELAELIPYLSFPCLIH